MQAKQPDISTLPEVQDLVKRALAEDIGTGDVTSDALVDDQGIARAAIISRGACTVAGIRVATLVFHACRPDLSVRALVEDGASVAGGQTVMEIAGNARAILAAERVALNFLQRMSGIATLTRRYVDKAGPHGVIVLDTRKTTPGLRVLEKYAVRCGGGENHRTGLWDRVLIKDNHRAFCKSGNVDLPTAVRMTRQKHPSLSVEIEVESADELRAVLPAAPDWILLDNMSAEILRRCVAINQQRCKLEASGGVTLDNVEAIARTGVDAISIGALTHSAPAADFSLEFLT